MRRAESRVLDGDARDATGETEQVQVEELPAELFQVVSPSSPALELGSDVAGTERLELFAESFVAGATADSEVREVTVGEAADEGHGCEIVAVGEDGFAHSRVDVLVPALEGEGSCRKA